MAITRERTKKHYLMDDSGAASESLATKQYHFVKITPAATGSATVESCDTAGEMPYGILQNAPADGEMAEISVDGINELVMASTCNAGAELTTNMEGKGAVAASGQYVRAIAREASLMGEHIISVYLCHYYKA